MTMNGENDFLKTVAGVCVDSSLTKVKGSLFHMMMHYSQDTQEFSLSEVRYGPRSDGPYQRKVTLDQKQLKGHEIRIFDQANNAITTLSFSDEKLGCGTFKDEYFQQEVTKEFRDIATGVEFTVTFNTQGVPRYVYFSSKPTSDLVQTDDSPNKPFIAKDARNEFDLDGSYFVNRTFQCFCFETGERLDICYGPNGIKNLPEFENYKKSLPLQKVLADVPVESELEQLSPKEIRVRAVKSLKEKLADVKKLPALGERADIFEEIYAKALSQLAQSFIYDEGDLEDHDPVLGSVNGGFGHMALLGNPGTLKTVLAEVLYDAARASGKITGPLIRINGRDIVRGYVGQTDSAMRDLVDQAVAQNGMIFIDEFHALDDTDEGSVSKSSFGAIAAKMLIGAMEEHRDKFSVVIAGYPEDMERAIKNIDKGLKDRLGDIYSLPDYDADGLKEIFDYLLSDRYKLTPKAREIAHQKIEEAVANKDETFSNGRLMRKFARLIEKEVACRQALSGGLFEEVLEAEKDGSLTEEFIKQARKEAGKVYASDVSRVDLMMLDKKEPESAGIGFSASLTTKLGGVEVANDVVRTPKRKPIRQKLEAK